MAHWDGLSPQFPPAPAAYRAGLGPASAILAAMIQGMIPNGASAKTVDVTYHYQIANAASWRGRRR